MENTFNFRGNVTIILSSLAIKFINKYLNHLIERNSHTKENKRIPATQQNTFEFSVAELTDKQKRKLTVYARERESM